MPHANPDLPQGEREGSHQEVFVLIRVDERLLALPVGSVEKGIRAVEVTPAAGTHGPIIGVIDVAGSIMPVFDLRLCLGLPPRDLALTDQFLLVTTREGQAALVVDSIVAVFRRATDAAGKPPYGLGPVKEVVESDQGLVLVHDLDRLLFPPDGTHWTVPQEVPTTNER